MSLFCFYYRIHTISVIFLWTFFFLSSEWKFTQPKDRDIFQDQINNDASPNQLIQVLANNKMWIFIGNNTKDEKSITVQKSKCHNKTSMKNLPFPRNGHDAWQISV